MRRSMFVLLTVAGCVNPRATPPPAIVNTPAPPPVPPRMVNERPERIQTVEDCVVIVPSDQSFRVVAGGTVTRYTKEQAQEAAEAIHAANGNARAVVDPEVIPVLPGAEPADRAYDAVIHALRASHVAHVTIASQQTLFGGSRGQSDEDLLAVAPQTCAEVFAKADECEMVLLEASSFRVVTAESVGDAIPAAELVETLRQAPPHVVLAGSSDALWASALKTLREAGVSRVSLAAPLASDPDALQLQAQSVCFDGDFPDEATRCPGAKAMPRFTKVSSSEAFTACAVVKAGPASQALTVGYAACAKDQACKTACPAVASPELLDPNVGLPTCRALQHMRRAMPTGSKNAVLACYLGSWLESAPSRASAPSPERVSDCREAAEVAYGAAPMLKRDCAECPVRFLTR